MSARRLVVPALAVLLGTLAGCGGSSGSAPLPANSPPLASQSESAPPPGTQPPGVLPDRLLTPGAVASTDLSTICTPSYSDSVRPPASYTTALKRRQLAAGYPGTAGLTGSGVEEDHLVMLALGGDPRSAANLWPEPRHITVGDGGEGGATAKDSYESWLYGQVCHSHTITLPDAQRALATDWYTAWNLAGLEVAT